jgi:hypothetical protein
MLATASLELADQRMKCANEHIEDPYRPDWQFYPVMDLSPIDSKDKLTRILSILCLGSDPPLVRT